MQNLRTDCPSTHVFLCALFFIEQKMFNSPHICYAFARFKYSYFDSWSTVLCTYSTCVPELSQTVIKSITVDVCYALVTPWSLYPSPGVVQNHCHGFSNQSNASGAHPPYVYQKAGKTELAMTDWRIAFCMQI